MNLVKLFEMQKNLDEHIEKEHPVKEGENRLSKKILALQIELGELANELPEVFKFWSNKKNNYDKALEEFVDGLHFFISTAPSLRKYETIEGKYHPVINKKGNIERQLSTLFLYAAKLNKTSSGDYLSTHTKAFNLFLGLGQMLGFNCEQIEKGYIDKNAVNHQRQESGY